jgi:arylsulfatase A-like enzyme
VSDIAIRLWKERDPEKPVFMWVHYSDPHAPYRFHRKYNPWGVKPGKLDKRDEVRAQYDSEIAYTDEQISRLLEVLPADAVILFVADHGESLYEHDYLGHGRRIYQAGLQIPLMIRASGVESGRTNVPARGVDIGPTLLGLAGFAPLPGMLGVDLIASPPEPDRIRVVETYGGAVPNLPGAHALMASRPPQRQGALAEGWKLILNGEEREVFYLPEDPMEGKNLAEREPGHAAALDRLIREWVEATPTGEAGTAELSSEDVQALENLGYL